MTGRNQRIAVVGMAMRVPGASSPEAFWTNLLRGRDTLARPDTATLARQGVPRQVIDDPNFIAARPLLRDIEYFDAGFFDIPPYEAERTDPVHRLFLECAWEAVERAGLAGGPGTPVTGVFAGVEGEYGRTNLSTGAITRDAAVGLPIRIGTGSEFAPTRTSFKLDLTGPSFAVEAACATSLLAVHLAARSLRQGECEYALAGGGTVLLPHEGGYLATVDGMLSTSGRIHAFDARADGTIFGSGVGVVALCSLERALEENHHVHAVLLGSGTSNDGAPESKESFIAPSREGQIAAIEAAMRDAHVSAETIGYMEGHGTGTLLGDPVEVESVATIYRRDTTKRQFCALGSVKNNVGHLRNAAGVVSLIKACLTLEHATLPPSANYAQSNPLIDLEASPFYINKTPAPWPETRHPRRAAVSAFGFGGTNAHVVLEAHSATPESRQAPVRPVLLPVSARDPDALHRLLSDLDMQVAEHPELNLEDIAHTLRRRRHWQHAACVLADRSCTRLRDAETVRLDGHRSHRSVAWLFPGQGAQEIGMGRRLYDTEPVYRDTVNQCAEVAALEIGVDLRELIHRGTVDEESRKALRQTIHAQPALFMVEYALARLLESWGLRADTLLGHSIGEVVAACLAGVFDLQDGMRLVTARARLMQACEPGSMLAIFLPAEDVKAELPGELDIAAVNAPGLTVVAGPVQAAKEFAAGLAARGVGHRILETSHAFHSWMMGPAIEPFREALAGVSLRPPQRSVISNLSGRPLTAELATDPEYWVEHMRRPVDFSAGARTLLGERHCIFVEVGPGTTLSELLRQHDKAAKVTATLPRCADPVADAQRSALMALGRAWCAGAELDWSRLEGKRRVRKVILPTYPFQRDRYWIDRDPSLPSELLKLYTRQWHREPLSTPSGDREHPDPVWLVFDDEPSAAITERLRRRGQSVLALRRGTRCRRIDDGLWTVRAASRDDLQHVLAGVANDAPLHVVHAWLVGNAEGREDSHNLLERCAEQGFHTLLALVQAASGLGRIRGLKLLVVADGMQAIDDEPGPACPEKALVTGPCRVVPQEIEGVAMRAIDLPPVNDGVVPGWAADAIVAEAGNLDDPQQVIAALRPQGRYVERIIELPEPRISRPRLRAGAVVLITGALGGLGLHFAGLLHDLVGARLVLVSRRALPPHERWPDRAAGDGVEAQVIRKLLELTGRGAVLTVLQADAADYASLAGAVAAARNRYGEIHGVVHAAGVIDDGPALTKTVQTAERVFAGKVRGALNLERLFAGRRLDMFVHFSSRAAVTPGQGQVDYSAANAVLDALAVRGRVDADFHCALAWGAFQEAGMALRSAATQAVRPSTTGAALQHPTEPFDHPLLAYRRRADNETIYGGTLRPSEHWVVDEHRLDGRALMSATTVIDCVYCAYADYSGHARVQLSDITFTRPLFVDDGIELEITVAPRHDRDRFTVRSARNGGGDFTVHATGDARIIVDDETPHVDPGGFPAFDEQRDRLHGVKSGERWRFGSHWQCRLARLETGNDTWLRVRLPEDRCGDFMRYGAHPSLLDIGQIYTTHRFDVDPTIPYSIGSIRVYGPVATECLVHGEHRARGGSGNFRLRFADPTGRLAVAIDGFVRRTITTGTSENHHTIAHGGPAATPLPGPFRACVGKRGDLESIGFEEVRPVPPGPGEVQIEVAAAGLNFRDVLGALGQLDEVEPELQIGSECAGVIRAVGDGVSGLRAGDPVMAMARASLASTVTVDATKARRLPAGMSFEEAAGIPIAFLTADYALNHLARLQAGERVLIHSATGGVGLAAVQIARLAGAEIFATAGRDSKRNYLEQIGIRHVMDSRSVSFPDQIRDLTAGEGVDVVLNSLAGEFIAAGLSVLKPLGRFVEIGKRDIYSEQKLSLYPFRKNLAYFSVDLAVVEHQNPALFTSMSDSLLARFDLGALRPLPTSALPIDRIRAGFQRMAGADHIGKLVFRVATPDAAAGDPVHRAAHAYDFRQKYGDGIPLAMGLETFRRLLSSDAVAVNVMAVEYAGDAGARRSTPRTARRDREQRDLEIEYREPCRPEEQWLAQLWEKTLGIAPVGIDDDFFDLGGDSISAVQIQTAIMSEYHTRMPMETFLENPTIARLSKVITTNRP